MSHLWLCAVSFPAQYAQGFGEIVCRYCPSPLINEATSPTPMPLIKSLLPRPIPRSFELPKSCRECPTISQIGIPTCKDLVLHLLLIDVSSKWLALANTGVSKVCEFTTESWNTEFDTARRCYVHYEE